MMKEPESKGTKIAKEIRNKCNKLTREERDELLAVGIAMTYCKHQKLLTPTKPKKR